MFETAERKSGDGNLTAVEKTADASLHRRPRRKRRIDRHLMCPPFSLSNLTKKSLWLLEKDHPPDRRSNEVAFLVLLNRSFNFRDLPRPTVASGGSQLIPNG